jgi:hypothetical protein
MVLLGVFSVKGFLLIVLVSSIILGLLLWVVNFEVPLRLKTQEIMRRQEPNTCVIHLERVGRAFGYQCSSEIAFDHHLTRVNLIRTNFSLSLQTVCICQRDPPLCGGSDLHAQLPSR